MLTYTEIRYNAREYLKGKWSEVIMLTYTEIRYNAREYLKGKWNNPCALIFLILAIIN